MIFQNKCFDFYGWRKDARSEFNEFPIPLQQIFHIMLSIP